MNPFQLKAKSTSTALAVLFGLWLLAYILGWGSKLIEYPSNFFFALPITLLVGWIILPQNLLHNLFGMTYESTPEWSHWVSLVGYWICVMRLQVTFICTRHWFLLLILAGIVLTSANGCAMFVEEHGGDYG